MSSYQAPQDLRRALADRARRRARTEGTNPHARGVAGLEQYRTLGEVEILAERFVTPLLAGSAPARWRPDRLEWA